MYQFTVEASGTSPLTYTWYINDMEYNDAPEDPSFITVPMNFTQERTIEVMVQVTNHDDNTEVTFSDTDTLVIYTPRGEYTN